METTIKNAVGNGNGLLIDGNNQAHTYSVTETIVQSATEKGSSFNINTGWIGLTSSTASAVFYFYNGQAPVNGESSFVIDTLVIAIDAVGTTTSGDMCDITLIRNPTGGTIVSGASAVSINQNRNFGSSKTLDSTTLVYKGAEGNTLTGGSDFALIGQNVGSRGTYPVDIELPKGSSFGVTIDTNTTGGTTSVYVAAIGHLKDGKNLS